MIVRRSSGFTLIEVLVAMAIFGVMSMLAYMTLGEYPQHVPKQWLIPQKAFESEYELDRFYDVSGPLGLDVISHPAMPPGPVSGQQTAPCRSEHRGSGI